MSDEIIVETVSTEVIEVGTPGPQGPAGAAGTGLETLTTQGDTLYRGASTGERLPIGTTGQILRVSASGLPEWGSAPASGVSSVNGESGAVVLDGSDIDTSGNDDLAAFVTYEFADGNGLYYPLPDTTIGNKRVYRTTTGHHVFFQSLRWHITDGSPNTQNIIESSDDDNAAWPWLSAWDGGVEKAQLSTIVGRARSTFLFLGDNIPNTSVSGLASVAASGAYDDLTGKPTIPSASTTTPAALGTAAAGSAINFARADHVHALPNASALLSTGAGEGDIPVAQGDGTIAWQNGTTWAGLNITATDVGAAAATHASAHASGGSDPLTPSAIGAQSIFATDSASAAVSGVPLQLSSARAKTWTLENVHSNRDVYLPVTGIQAGDVAVLIGGGTMTYTLTVKVPAAGGAAIIDPENTPNSSPVVISATGQQYRFIVTNPANFNPWRFVSVDTHTHPASAISDSTTAGRALLTAADAAAQRTSLGLGTAATSASSAFAAASHSHELTALAATGATNGHVLTANGSNGVTFAALPSSGVSSVSSSASDVLGVSGSDITGVDAGAADRLVFWDDSASKLTYASVSGMAFDGTTLRAAQVDVYTANDTWNKPSGAKKVEILLIGGGGGGGNGRRGAEGTLRCGGGGGAGGSVVIMLVDANRLNTSETVTIGSGGGGAASVSADDTNGGTGTAGGSTTFSIFTALGGAGGGGGTDTTAGAGAASGSNRVTIFGSISTTNNAGSAGANASATGNGGGNISSPAGGGGGGGRTTTNSGSNGGNGGGVGNSNWGLTNGGNRATGGGENGAASQINYFGSGGGGGQWNGNSPGGNGGNYGAGGGGGGAAVNGAGGSNKGGDGASGIAVITTFF